MFEQYKTQIAIMFEQFEPQDDLNIKIEQHLVLTSNNYNN